MRSSLKVRFLTSEGFHSIVVVRSLRKRKVASSILAGSSDIFVSFFVSISDNDILPILIYLLNCHFFLGLWLTFKKNI